jgi:hypothetical protein
MDLFRDAVRNSQGLVSTTRAGAVSPDLQHALFMLEDFANRLHGHAPRLGKFLRGPVLFRNLIGSKV